MKYIYIVLALLLFGCASNKSYRLPSSINEEGNNIKPTRCAVKCAIGPVSRNYFQIKAIKVKYINADELAPKGTVEQPAINAMYDYCKRYSDAASKKKKTKYTYIAVSSKAPLYHGQLLKTDNSGNIEIPNQTWAGLNVYTACPGE